MRRGELQEPSPPSLPIVRIARRKRQARTAAPAAPERLEEVSYKSPALPPHRTDCPAEEASADRRACSAGEIRRGELQEPSPPSPSYGLCPAEEASADRRLAEKTGWTLSDLLDSLAERGRAPVLVVLAYG